jgi:hypothetical protein
MLHLFYEREHYCTHCVDSIAYICVIDRHCTLYFHVDEDKNIPWRHSTFLLAHLPCASVVVAYRAANSGGPGGPPGPLAPRFSLALQNRVGPLLSPQPDHSHPLPAASACDVMDVPYRRPSSWLSGSYHPRWHIPAILMTRGSTAAASLSHPELGPVCYIFCLWMLGWLIYNFHTKCWRWTALDHRCVQLHVHDIVGMCLHCRCI